jgi:hypothetical protein
MKFLTILRRETGQRIVQVGLFMMMGWFTSYSFADEAATNRFPPSDSNRSSIRTQPGVLLAQKSDTQLILEKLEQLEQRIERLEKKQAEPKQTGLPPTLLPRSDKKQDESKGMGSSSPPPSGPALKAALHEQLLQEELGSVQGVILWQGKPLVKGMVRIELEKYTGVSLASVKKMLSSDEKESYETDQGISLNTQTDDKGRYAFEKVPPGTYRLYWRPDFKTGWVHRLREKPDFEVKTGRSTVQNIPEKQSILKLSDKK